MLLPESIIIPGIRSKKSKKPKKLFIWYFKKNKFRKDISKIRYLLNSQGIKGLDPSSLANTSNEARYIVSGKRYLTELLNIQSEIILFRDRIKII
tara:strand:- start:1542 stop:1826 length:285 start_codon:yes stop_codon:yes gene_type:complete